MSGHASIGSVISVRFGPVMLALAGALAACADPAAAPGRVDWLGPDEHRIVVAADGFAQTAPLRVGYAGPWQTEEYALFEAGGRRLELVFAEARKTVTVALEYQLPITSMVPTWNANAGRELAWGPVVRYDWPPGVWFYRTYRAGEQGRPCVGLQIEWDEIGGDPENRPRRVLFGYACAAAGEVLGDDEARALIRGIMVRSRYGRTSRRPGTRRSSDGAAALAAARGQDDTAQRGNPRFPFAFARYYSESGSSRRP